MKFRALSEARWILGFLAVVGLGTLFLFPLFAVVVGAMLLFTLYFFRDPDRTPPADESLAVSPADGVVVEVSEVEESEYLHGRVRRVGIFLSIFDVHVNRAPLPGEILHSVPDTGRYLDARHPDSARLNARRTWVIAGPLATVIVRQITGAVARRICAWSGVGDSIERGQRFGMIRFGSRTEADFPMDAEILVQPGDRVRGGETAIARLPGTSTPAA